MKVQVTRAYIDHGAPYGTEPFVIEVKIGKGRDARTEGRTFYKEDVFPILKRIVVRDYKRGLRAARTRRLNAKKAANKKKAKRR